jgi:hypothetical protein
MKSKLNFKPVIAILAMIYSCNTQPANKLANATNKEYIVSQTFKTADGWGYAVFINNKIFIKQSFIPVIAGNKGFEKKEDAIKVASLVVTKLKQHEKPTIHPEELQALGITERK